ncbi:MAG: T9SS type A sorting domain-containing protein [Bacteroidetes bacterium]|nr:T9SS type A sorting domain-containing protein [Bacteroidota bacterium]
MNLSNFLKQIILTIIISGFCVSVLGQSSYSVKVFPKQSNGWTGSVKKDYNGNVDDIDNEIHVGKPTLGWPHRGFIIFNIESWIPTLATIQKIELYLWPYNSGGWDHYLIITHLTEAHIRDRGVDLWNSISSSNSLYYGDALKSIEDKWVKIELNARAVHELQSLSSAAERYFGIGLMEGGDDANRSSIFGYSNNTYRPYLQVYYTLPPPLSSITISGSTSVNENSSASYTCTAKYTDGSSKNVTNSATWSENSNYATINSSGVLTTSSVNSDQSCTITASYSGKSDTHNITIKNLAPTLSSITIIGSTSVNENSSASYTCTANYSDGSTQNVTNSTTWSENSSYATINSSGDLTTSSVTSDQSCTISASYGGKSDTHNITIKNIPGTLSSITISGPTSVNENSSANYTCTANYSDGTTQNVTNSATWSEDSDYANINSSGTLTTLSVNDDKAAYLRASYGGMTIGYWITIKNIPVTMSTITISGPITVNENSTASYTCTANYSDGSSQIVTFVTWSDNSDYATINTNGILTTSSVNSDQSCTITAIYGGKSDTHNITIKNVTSTPILSLITISGSTTVNENSSASYTCTANYSDGSTQNVTNSATWTENSSYATINSSGVLITGSVSSDQSCTIIATYSGKSVTHNITIKDVAASLSSITINGPTSVNENSYASYTCTANYSDGSTQNVTNSTTWSENSSYATINSSGVLTTGSVNSDQSCTITATYSGKSNTRNITILKSNNNISNLALSTNGAVASASSEGSYEGVRYAYFSNDNDLNSFWANDGNLPSWLKIGLKQTYVLDSLGILWSGHNQTFNILLSVDNSNWTKIISQKESNTNAYYLGSIYYASDKSYQSIIINPTIAKYIKVEITQSSAPSTHKFKAIINELKAFGTTTTGINDDIQNANLKVFPNPTNDKLTIEIKDCVNEPYTFEIYDSYGKILKKFEEHLVIGNYRKIIDCSQFSNGAYFLKITSKKGNHTHKFTIIH